MFSPVGVALRMAVFLLAAGALVCRAEPPQGAPPDAAALDPLGIDEEAHRHSASKLAIRSCKAFHVQMFGGYWDPLSDASYRYFGLALLPIDRQDDGEARQAKHRAALDVLRRAGADVDESWSEDRTRLSVDVYFQIKGERDGKNLSLAELPLLDVVNLSELWLEGIDATDADCKALAQSGTLRQLHVVSTHMTDRGLAELGRLDRLEELTLIASGITPAGVERLLAELPRLRSLRLHASLINLSAADARRIRKEFPAVELGLR